MNMPGRSRTGSRPSSTVMSSASYEAGVTGIETTSSCSFLSFNLSCRWGLLSPLPLSKPMGATFQRWRADRAGDGPSVECGYGSRRCSPVYLREPGATRTLRRSEHRLAKLLGETPEHCRTGQLQLSGPSGMVDRDDELAAPDELRAYLASHLGTRRLASQQFVTRPRTRASSIPRWRSNRSIADPIGTVGPATDLFIHGASRYVFVLPANALPTAEPHPSSLPSARRSTSFGAAPGGNSPAVVRSAWPLGQLTDERPGCCSRRTRRRRRQEAAQVLRPVIVVMRR